MDINETVKKVHRTAVDKGWWEGEERSPLEIHMLIVSEVAEATESVRKGEKLLGEGARLFSMRNGLKKPEGEDVELVDAVILGEGAGTWKR